MSNYITITLNHAQGDELGLSDFERVIKAITVENRSLASILVELGKDNNQNQVLMAKVLSNKFSIPSRPINKEFPLRQFKIIFDELISVISSFSPTVQQNIIFKTFHHWLAFEREQVNAVKVNYPFLISGLQKNLIEPLHVLLDDESYEVSGLLPFKKQHLKVFEVLVEKLEPEKMTHCLHYCNSLLPAENTKILLPKNMPKQIPIYNNFTLVMPETLNEVIYYMFEMELFGIPHKELKESMLKTRVAILTSKERENYVFVETDDNLNVISLVGRKNSKLSEEVEKMAMLALKGQGFKNSWFKGKSVLNFNKE